VWAPMEPNRSDFSKLEAFLDKFYPFLLALVMMAGFMWLITEVVCYCPENLDLLKTLSAIFLGPIGTILGFYFGQRPTEKLTQRVGELTELSERTLEEKENATRRERVEASEEVERMRNDLREAIQTIEQLKKLIP